MDANQFDQLAKTMSGSTSRRRALGMITAGGLFGAFTGGRIAAAQGSTCTLDFVTTVRSGPTSGQLLTNDAAQPGEARGALSFGLSSTGAIENGTLLLTDGTSLPVVGQATGNSLHIRVDAGQGLVLVGIGVGQQAISTCQGAIDGLMTGPQAGDLGDWHAVATGQATSTSSSNQQPARAAAAGPVLAPGGRSTGPAPTGATGPAPTGATGPAPTGATGPAPTGATGGTRLESCPTGQTRCADACVNLSSDRENCGACGLVCASEAPLICVEGECVSDESGECAPGTTRCGDVCVDTDTDPDNCGACQQSCADGVDCAGGVCIGEPVPETCEPGLTDCGGVCVDTDTDGDNCGTCGTICPENPTIFNCEDGICVPPDCGDGLTDCNGLCDNLLTSTINCGECGKTCLEGEVCAEGTCVLAGGGGCGNGLTKCSTGPGGLDFVCVNVQADTAHCGDCFQACAAGSTCQGGQCFAAPAPAECPQGQTNCFGTCTDTSNDNNNCGACGIPCAAGQVCQGNQCLAGGPACGDGQVVCGGVCTFTATDFFNCGACGNVCAEGQSCVSEACTDPAA